MKRPPPPSATDAKPEPRFPPAEIEAAAAALDADTIQKYANVTTDRKLIAVLERYSIPPAGSVKLVKQHVTVRDMAARLILHEIDHLDGITYIDRTSGETLDWAPPLYDRKRTPELKLCYPIQFDSELG